MLVWLRQNWFQCSQIDVIWELHVERVSNPENSKPISTLKYTHLIETP